MSRRNLPLFPPTPNESQAGVWSASRFENRAENGRILTAKPESRILEDAISTLLLAQACASAEPETGLRIHPKEQGAIPPRLPHTPPTTQRISPGKRSRRLCPDRQEKHGCSWNKGPDSPREKWQSNSLWRGKIEI